MIWVGGIESAHISGKEAPVCERRSRMETDQYLRALNLEYVYVAGDNIYYVPEGETDPVPQMVENCELSADTIALISMCPSPAKASSKSTNPNSTALW